MWHLSIIKNEHMFLVDVLVTYVYCAMINQRQGLWALPHMSTSMANIEGHFGAINGLAWDKVNNQFRPLCRFYLTPKFSIYNN